MKISKLKYVFAFVLLVAVSVVCTNVQAATMPNNGQIKLSTIIASQLAEIEDGDEDPSTPVLDRVVKSFNTPYQATVLGTTMNPVQFYTLKVKSSGANIKAYSLDVGNIVGRTIFGMGKGSDDPDVVGLMQNFNITNQGGALYMNDGDQDQPLNLQLLASRLNFFPTLTQDYHNWMGQ